MKKKIKGLDPIEMDDYFDAEECLEGIQKHILEAMEQAQAAIIANALQEPAISLDKDGMVMHLEVYPDKGEHRQVKLIATWDDLLFWVTEAFTPQSLKEDVLSTKDFLEYAAETAAALEANAAKLRALVKKHTP